jgi:hypothetical protein
MPEKIQALGVRAIAGRNEAHVSLLGVGIEGGGSAAGKVHGTAGIHRKLVGRCTGRCAVQPFLQH